MTKKDYKVIAEAIKKVENEKTGENKTPKIDMLVKELARVLKKDNDRFNDIKFLKAIYD